MAKKFFWNLLKSSPLLIAGVVGLGGVCISVAHELGFTTRTVSREEHLTLARIIHEVSSQKSKDALKEV